MLVYLGNGESVLAVSINRIYKSDLDDIIIELDDNTEIELGRDDATDQDVIDLTKEVNHILNAMRLNYHA